MKFVGRARRAAQPPGAFNPVGEGEAPFTLGLRRPIIKQLGVLVPTLLAVSGCNSSSGGSFNGTVAGYSLRVVESVFTPLPETDENPPFTLIVLTDRRGVCHGLQTGTWGKNTTSMAIYLFSSSPPASPGTYHLRTTDPMAGDAYFLKLDEHCQLAPGLSNSVPADSGSVVLESISSRSGGSAGGSFDIILKSGDRVTGTFDSAYCAPPSFESRTIICG